MPRQKIRKKIFFCDAAEITETAPELKAIWDKYSEAHKAGKSKEEEKLENQSYEKQASIIREKCHPGDIIYVRDHFFGKEGAMIELLCDYKKTIILYPHRTSCVLAPYRSIRPLQ